MKKWNVGDNYCHENIQSNQYDMTDDGNDGKSQKKAVEGIIFE